MSSNAADTYTDGGDEALKEYKHWHTTNTPESRVRAELRQPHEVVALAPDILTRAQNRFAQVVAKALKWCRGADQQQSVASKL